MSRYIDADAFAEKMKRQYCESCDKYQGLRCNRCSCGDWLDDLDFEPTADVVEVVRCNDCIYKEECGREVLVNEYDNDKAVDITGFLFYCSFGERADE